jgi:hypothetical protein
LNNMFKEMVTYNNNSNNNSSSNINTNANNITSNPTDNNNTASRSHSSAQLLPMDERANAEAKSVEQDTDVVLSDAVSLSSATSLFSFSPSDYRSTLTDECKILSNSPSSTYTTILVSCTSETSCSTLRQTLTTLPPPSSVSPAKRSIAIEDYRTHVMHGFTTGFPCSVVDDAGTFHDKWMEAAPNVILTLEEEYNGKRVYWSCQPCNANELFKLNAAFGRSLRQYKKINGSQCCTFCFHSDHSARSCAQKKHHTHAACDKCYRFGHQKSTCPNTPQSCTLCGGFHSPRFCRFFRPQSAEIIVPNSPSTASPSATASTAASAFASASASPQQHASPSPPHVATTRPPNSYAAAASSTLDQRMAMESGVGGKRKIHEIAEQCTQQAQQPQQRQQLQQPAQPYAQPQPAPQPVSQPTLVSLESAVSQQLTQIMAMLTTLSNRLALLEAEVATRKSTSTTASPSPATSTMVAAQSPADLHTGQAVNKGITATNNSNTAVPPSAHG